MRLILSAVAMLFLSAPTSAQPSQATPAAKSADPTFQVATIKPSAPDANFAIFIQGRRFATSAASVVDILKYSYGIHASQIVDAPSWIASEKFDILADPDTETRPTSDQFKSMVRDLMTDRFHLVFHHATRTLPVYAIQPAAKNGPFKPGPNIAANKEAAGIPSPAFRPTGELDANNSSITDLAAFLQRYVLDRPVVDQTRIEGRFNLTLKWTPDEGQFNGSAILPRSDSPDALPSLYTAIQNQLGLRLVATRAPIDVLVIDHIEQPTEN